MRTLWGLVAVLSCSPGWAGIVTYQFTGEGIAGDFHLNTDTPWVETSDPYKTMAVVASSDQIIYGKYAGLDFSGTATLHMADYPEFDSDGHESHGMDYWIIRADVTGSISHLNLFLYFMPGRFELSLLPRFENANLMDYSVVFNDGTSIGRDLTVVTPEPPIWALMGISLLLLARFRARRV